MTSSPAPRPRVAEVRYELPAMTQRLVECPHCGGPVDAAAAPPVQATAPVLQVLPVAVMFEVESVQVPVMRFMDLLVEVIDGRRPVEQLRRIAAPAVLRYVRAASPTRCPRRVGQVLSWRVSRPAQDGAEASAVVMLNGRIRAVAARLEPGTATGWMCTSLRIL